jgi:hypothetical protein
MSVDERHRLEMFERLTEVLGADVAETLLAHLPPPGERVATAAHVESLHASTDERIESLRADTTAHIESLGDDTTAQITSLRDEMHHLFDLHGERMAARWRRDLLLLAGPQFLVLLGIILSLNL